MKKLFVLIFLFLFFIVSPIYAAEYRSVMKDTPGNLGAAGGVTYFVTKTGVTVWSISTTSGVSFFMDIADIEHLFAKHVTIHTGLSGASASFTTVEITTLTASGDITGYDFTGSKSKSGASVIVNPASGITLVSSQLNTIISHNNTGSSIYGLPAISGVSTIYVKFIEGTANGGMTIYPTDSEPFHGDGLSGTSYLALPPGNQFESATIYGVQISGTCKYWFVEATGSWVCGN